MNRWASIQLESFTGLRAVVLLMALCGCETHAPSAPDRAAILESLYDSTADPVEYYATHSPTTDPGEYKHLLDQVGGDIQSIVRTVQGVLIRPELIDSESLPISKRRVDREVNIPTVRRMLERIAELDARPLTDVRPATKRLVSVCAQYAMLTTAVLRHHGVPARARGGFETYFNETKHHDHWITEVWDRKMGRWVRVDAELEEGARDWSGRLLGGLDLPEYAFLTGARAWQLCRREGKRPEQFGIAGNEWYGGWDFVLNELLLDFNALNKVESLPWDDVRLSRKGYDRLTEQELALLDDVAEAVIACHSDFGRLRSLFKDHPDLRKPG